MFGTNSNHYQPVQLYHFSQPGVRCDRFLPSDRLSRYIYYYWILHIEPGEFDLPVIPDGATDLVLSPSVPGFSTLYFPTTEKFEIPLNGPMVYTGVCFHTDSLMESLGMGIDPLKAIESGNATTSKLGLETLVYAIQGVVDTDTTKSLLDTFFEAKLNTVKKTDLHWTEMGIFDSLDAEDVQAMSAKIGLSERHFRRVTARLFGLGPKKLHRIIRLQSALQTLFRSDVREVSTGYFDDSHMFREFKELLGMRPSEVRAMAEKYNQKLSL